MNALGRLVIMKNIIYLSYCIFLIGCTSQTTEITTGSYGPFLIGDSNRVTLAKVEKIIHPCSIEAILSEEIYVENPTLDNLKVFNRSNGILIWLDRNPSPLRLVLDGEKFIKVKDPIEKCQSSNEKINIRCREMNKLIKNLEFTNSRADVYQAIVEFETELHKSVGNYFLGFGYCNTDEEWSIASYKTFLLDNDAWRFYGLKELSRFNNPFYSDVKLYFYEEKLSKVVHWSAPYEVP